MKWGCCGGRKRKVFIGLLTGLCLTAIVVLLAGKIFTGLSIIFASHLLLLYAQLNPVVQWLGPVVTRFRTDKKEIWLTIDDGPDPEETPVILKLLDEHQAKATFFVIGNRAKNNPSIVRQIVERGHQVANHSMNHPERSFWCLPKRQLEREIADCSEVISELSGAPPELFRAPVGHKPWSLHSVLRKEGLPLIAWTARGFDGVSTDSERIVHRIQKHIKPGAIVLLHEGKGTLSETLGELLADLSDENYCCVLPAPDSFICGRR